jgi:hypothetical protein
MFDGVMAQLRPWAQHCNSEFQRLMYQLGRIEQAVKDGAKESEYGDRIIRVAGNIAGAGSVDFDTVPNDQLWVLDYLLADAAGWVQSLGGEPRMTATNMSTANGQLVMLPGEKWTLTVTGASNYAAQLTRQYKIERPTPAHIGGYQSPEGRTSSDGPPQHELGRDARQLPTISA